MTYLSFNAGIEAEMNKTIPEKQILKQYYPSYPGDAGENPFFVRKQE